MISIKNRSLEDEFRAHHHAIHSPPPPRNHHRLPTPAPSLLHIIPRRNRHPLWHVQQNVAGLFLLSRVEHTPWREEHVEFPRKVWIAFEERGDLDDNVTWHDTGRLKSNVSHELGQGEQKTYVSSFKLCMISRNLSYLRGSFLNCNLTSSTKETASVRFSLLPLVI